MKHFFTTSGKIIPSTKKLKPDQVKWQLTGRQEVDVSCRNERIGSQLKGVVRGGPKTLHFEYSLVIGGKLKGIWSTDHVLRRRDPWQNE